MSVFRGLLGPMGPPARPLLDGAANDAPPPGGGTSWLAENTGGMDQRLEAVRTALETGDISSAALNLLSGVAADADREEDVWTLEETLDLARAIADSAHGPLRDDAEELVAGCEGRLSHRRPLWWDE